MIKEIAASPLKALILLGTLETNIEESNTYFLSKVLSKELKKLGVIPRLINLSTSNLLPGESVKSDDGMPAIWQEIQNTDILIFATPIWWNHASSLLQRIMEKMDNVDNEYMENMEKGSKAEGKVFGALVTGKEDGVQSIQGQLYAFAVNLGFTVPSYALAYYLGVEKKEEILKAEHARVWTKRCAEQLVKTAKAIKK